MTELESWLSRISLQNWLNSYLGKFFHLLLNPNYPNPNGVLLGWANYSDNIHQSSSRLFHKFIGVKVQMENAEAEISNGKLSAAVVQEYIVEQPKGSLRLGWIAFLY
ncbi:unnamed protein product [Vicia faba]|uniref:Uncharacterized protein n=1 Tax=Vicia faba TaxID=3906 RepID=A0AAV1AWW1_VICFA|nr:unnamed protein product [Vicia faba]